MKKVIKTRVDANIRTTTIRPLAVRSKQSSSVTINCTMAMTEGSPFKSSFERAKDTWYCSLHHSSDIVCGKLICSYTREVAAVILQQKKNPRGIKHLHYTVLGSDVAIPPIDESNIYAFKGKCAIQFSSIVESTCLSEPAAAPINLSIPRSINFFDTNPLHYGYQLPIPIPKDLHGPVLTGVFGSSEIALGKSAIVYAADVSPTPHANCFDPNIERKREQSRFQYKENWGERYNQVSIGRVFIAERTTSRILPVDWPHEFESLGQVQPVNFVNGFVCVAWDVSEPYRLGVSFCQNRKSCLYLVTLDPLETSFDTLSVQSIKPRKIQKITFEGNQEYFSCHSPIVNKISSDAYQIKFVVVDNKNVGNVKGLVDTLSAKEASKTTLQIGAHWSSVQMAGSNIDAKTFEAAPAFINKIDGLLCDLKNSKMKWFSLEQRGVIAEVIGVDEKNCPTTQIVLIDDSLKIRIIQSGQGARLLDAVLGGDDEEMYALLSFSTVQISHCVGVYVLKFSIAELVFEQLLPKLSKQHQFSIKQELIQKNDAEHVQWFQNRHLWVRSGDAYKKGLIVSLHGGPHSITLAEYSVPHDFLKRLGYDILHINYPGSIGFGDNEMLSLAGHIGERDVFYCKKVIHALKEEVLEYKNANIFVIGGSHGGFVALHLVGQFPNDFRAASVRNPVTNLVANLTASDIPDWTLFEGVGDKQAYKSKPQPIDDKETLWNLYANSPIRHVQKVKAKILIALGESDLRVPPCQGLEYYKCLKKDHANHHKLLWYPNNNHSLSHPEADADYWIETSLWFDQAVQETNSL